MEARYYQLLMNLKVTQFIDLGEHNGQKKVELLVKDTDDNPISLPTTIDRIDLTDNNLYTTSFIKCDFLARDVDRKDGDFLIHPYVYSYQSQEP